MNRSSHRFWNKARIAGDLRRSWCIWLEGWDFHACPACARECQLTDEAERLCPVLYAELIRANGIQEIETAFKTHPQSNCTHCRSERKPAQKGEDQAEGPGAAFLPGEVA